MRLRRRFRLGRWECLLGLVRGEWWIGARREFPLDGWTFGLFGLELFVCEATEPRRPATPPPSTFGGIPLVEANVALPDTVLGVMGDFGSYFRAKADGDPDPGQHLAVLRTGQCCDLHGRNCEPPSELCCEECTEAAHPDHADSSECIAPDVRLHPLPIPVAGLHSAVKAAMEAELAGLRQHVKQLHPIGGPPFIIVRKLGAYVPTSCCVLTDSTGVNHCTHPPAPRPPLRRRLWWRARSWWRGLRLRTGSWVAGVDLEDD